MQPAKKIAGIRPGRQDELLAWYAKQPKDIRLQVHGEKLRIFRGWLGSEQTTAEKTGYTKEELDYLALIAAVASLKGKIDEPKKQKDFELRIQQITSGRKQKSSPMQSKIEEFLPLIHQLRCQQPKPVSWRKIQEYIRKHHHKSFKVPTMHKVYMAEYGSVDVTDES